MSSQTPSGTGPDPASTRELPARPDGEATAEITEATAETSSTSEETTPMDTAKASTARGFAARASLLGRRRNGRGAAAAGGTADDDATAADDDGGVSGLDSPGAQPGAEETPPAPATASTAPAAVPQARRPAPAGSRRVRLALSRVDPWSVMKLSFLLSIAAGIALVVATAVVWNVLNTMEVFTLLDELIRDIAGTESFINILEYVEFSRIMSISVVVAVVDIVLLTALATLGAFLYNIVAALVGGLHVTLTDE